MIRARVGPLSWIESNLMSNVPDGFRTFLRPSTRAALCICTIIFAGGEQAAMTTRGRVRHLGSTVMLVMRESRIRRAICAAATERCGQPARGIAIAVRSHCNRFRLSAVRCGLASRETSIGVPLNYLGDEQRQLRRRSNTSRIWSQTIGGRSKEEIRRSRA